MTAQIESLPDFDGPLPPTGYFTVVLSVMQDNVGSVSVSEDALLSTWH